MTKNTSDNHRLLRRLSKELLRSPKRKDLSNKNPSSKWHKGDKFNLPADWDVEERPRVNGDLAGYSDLYFYDPSTGKQYRSFKTAKKFLDYVAKFEESVRQEVQGAQALLLHYGASSSSSSSAILEYAQRDVQSNRCGTSAELGKEDPPNPESYHSDDQNGQTMQTQ